MYVYIYIYIIFNVVIITAKERPAQPGDTKGDQEGPLSLSIYIYIYI